jgi:hypothetical protein
MNAIKFYLGSVLRIAVQITLLLIVIALLLLRLPADMVRAVVFDPLTWLVDYLSEKVMVPLDDAQKRARKNYEATL